MQEKKGCWLFGGISKKGVRDLLEGFLSSQRNRHVLIIHNCFYKINRIYKKIFFYTLYL